MRKWCGECQFNPKPKAMAGSGMDGLCATPAIAFGFGLNGLMQEFGAVALGLVVLAIS
ncbi:MAG: hypothetical protein ISR77_26930 [Pirellulaceae bacterium]|nr:hypothetical protein [Pirellulaceae bacterium]